MSDDLKRDRTSTYSAPTREVPDESQAASRHVAPEPEGSPFSTGSQGTMRRALGGVAIAALISLAAAFSYFTTRAESQAAARTPEHQNGAPADTNSAGPIHLDADAARRIGVTFATVMTGSLSAEVRAVGQVTFDETRVKAIAPRIDGWVERLFVDFTGREVREGEPLLSIYSPMLVSTQEELLLALRLAKDVEGGTDDAKRNATDLVTSARRRLAYWDIPESDVAELERSGTVTRTITLRSPARGVVVEKAVLSGQRIMNGETLFRVADLSTVWVEGEIFERDLASVRLGTPVGVEVEAYQGEVRRGVLTYLYPTVDPATRTTRVRVELANPGLRLRPGMYATITMPGARRSNVVTIPRSAVLATGKRVIAFVQMDDGMLAPREIVTGLMTDDRVEVLAGLQAGDIVVSSATFLVDAESNLGAAMGAMLNMPGMEMKSMTDTPGMEMGVVPGDSLTPPPGRTPPPHDHREE